MPDHADLISERWTRVKAIFHEALERPTDQRSSFLADACHGDVALRKEVESLLASDLAAGSFIETPAPRLLSDFRWEIGSTLPGLSAGDRLGVYEVTDFVGAGGMGEVYRARDTRLGRHVAIKIVRRESVNPHAQRRLVREARHASILNHLNICTIHQVEEADGLPFIVMEHVEGRPLHELLRDRPLAADAVLDYAIQVADALEHAHDRGIVHRDLKSSNVMVMADGRVKVLDFGLSKRLAEATDLQITSSTIDNATLAGTLSHMAPEALLGQPPDTRTDIWAFGVLLYEMATADLPFRGQTPFETSSAILHARLGPLPSCVPLGLRLVIERCLTKDPAGRYQRAADIRAALRALQTPASVHLIGRLLVARYRRVLAVSIATTLLLVLGLLSGPWWESRLGIRWAGSKVRNLAILPLENASGDPTQDYLADSITEALISDLGALKTVRVISRTSAMKYRGARKSTTEIGRELGVDALVQGSIRRTGDAIRITARVTDATTGRVIWSEAYERRTKEALALQSGVLQAIASSLRIGITREMQQRLTETRAVDPDVYQSYLKGRFYWNQRTEASLHDAVDHFQTAIDLDPTYAPAYAGLANCYNQLGTVLVGTGSPEKFRPLAAHAAIQALQIDSSLADAHAALAYVKHYEWAWDDAEAEFKRSIELNPSYALAHVWYANLLMSLARFNEALREVQLARELDPFSLVVNNNVGWILHYARRYDEAVAQYKKTLGLDMNYVQARRRLAAALVDLGRFDESITAYTENIRLSERSAANLSGLATAYALSGRAGEAREILNELLGASSRRYVSPGMIADVYFSLGNNDRAFRWLEKSYTERANNMAYLAVDPRYDPVRNDPRFQSLLERVGLK